MFSVSTSQDIQTASVPKEPKQAPPMKVLQAVPMVAQQPILRTYGTNSKPIRLSPWTYPGSKKAPAPQMGVRPRLVHTVESPRHVTIGGGQGQQYRVIRLVQAPSNSTVRTASPIPQRTSTGIPVVRKAPTKIVRVSSDPRAPIQIVNRAMDGNQNVVVLNRGQPVVLRKAPEAPKEIKVTRAMTEVRPDKEKFVRVGDPIVRTVKGMTEVRSHEKEKLVVGRPAVQRSVKGVEDYLFGPMVAIGADDAPAPAEEVPEEEAATQPVVEEEPPALIETALEISPAEKKLLECLSWEGNCGTLPGFDKKFKLNEMGLLELDETPVLTSESSTESEPPQKKQKTGRGSDELTKCEHCGTYGMVGEFIQQKFCGNECRKQYEEAKLLQSQRHQQRTQRKVLLRRQKKELLAQRAVLQQCAMIEAREVLEQAIQKTRMELELVKLECPDSSCIDEDNDQSRAKYMKKVLKRAAPSHLFKDPFPSSKNHFKVGMKLEAIDPVHPSLFCVATVVEVKGHRLRLHFDGYPACHDFWVNSTSPDIFQPGWCERTGHKLTPPRGHEGPFNWTVYYESQNATAAPRHAFHHPQEKTLTPSGFRVGMKLEAVDKKNSKLVRVASVADVIENRILVHIDGWEDVYDFWADSSSPYIHPAGWCKQNEHILHPPPDWKSFKWDDYTAVSKTFSVPARSFKFRPPIAFRKGMKVEAVDRRNPFIIRIATIADVDHHQIKIRFDGWPESYAYWVDDDNPDIHPIGWCSRTRHPLTPPPRPDELAPAPGVCPTPGCVGAGHAFRTSLTHFTTTTCPYSVTNFLIDDLIPDRFNSTAEYQCAKESSYSKGTKPRNLLSRKVRILDHKKPSRKKETKAPSPAPSPYKKIDEENATLAKVKREMEEFMTGLGENPRSWTVEDVVQFISSFLSAEKGKVFEEQEIDGEALLMLGQTDLTDLLSFKLGPAIKLYKGIRALREQALDISEKT